MSEVTEGGGPLRRVCALGDVEPGGVRRVELDGCPALAVFNLDGEYYVTADRCTHAEASLAEGWIEDDVIECPFHGGSFHIPTGQALTRPVKTDLRTFPVTVAGDDVLIEVAPGEAGA